MVKLFGWHPGYGHIIIDGDDNEERDTVILTLTTVCGDDRLGCLSLFFY